MNFFEYQEDARRKTSQLVFYFICAVILIIAALYGAVLILLLLTAEGQAPQAERLTGWWHPAIFSGTAIVVLLIVTLGSSFRIRALSHGGPAVAGLLGARPVNPDSIDPDERKLLNVVEEMAIASGTPVPAIYLMEEDTTINAFAAGFGFHDAVIGVTSGCITQLNRDELQGVIAHEFSHIINGDMRLNIRLMGVLHGILVIGIIGNIVFRAAIHSGYHRGIYARTGSRSRQRGSPLPLIVFGLLVMAIGSIGVFFGKLIKSAVSRQREFLADASSVQYTRNPGGIAGALKKIARPAGGSFVKTPKAAEASHLFFANALTGSMRGLMDTHPPLEERIRRIDPSAALDPAPVPTAHRPDAAANAAAGFAGLYGPGPAITQTIAENKQPARDESSRAPDSAPGQAGNFVSGTGTVDPRDLLLARQFLEALPEKLREAAHRAEESIGLCCALLLSGDSAIRARQMKIIEQGLGPEKAALAHDLSAQTGDLKPEWRLPLLDIALPSLRGMDAALYPSFTRTIDDLVAADSRLSLFEYALKNVIRRHLDPLLAGRPFSRPVEYYALKPLMEECRVLLSSLAWQGKEDRSSAEESYRRGMARLDKDNREDLLSLDFCPPERVLEALDKLSCSSPFVKKRLLEACAECVWANRLVTAREAELLRLAADILDCPVPPLSGSSRPLEKGR